MRKLKGSKVNLLLLFLCWFSISIASHVLAYETKVISWKDAHKYYGQYVTVEGKIVGTYNSGKVCFLNFNSNWKEGFTAVIFASDFYKFPPQPEEYYKNKTVRVTGTIKEYKGKPEIILKDPSQIEIVKKTKNIFEKGGENNLIKEYNSLNEEGKKLFREFLEFLVKKYPKGK